MSKKVYLAGPIKGLSYDDCTNWREDAIRKLAEVGIDGISPMRFKEILSREKVMGDHYEHVLCCDSGIGTRDNYDVKTCDVFLANLLGAKKVTIGTMIEFGWASADGKPIVTAIEREGNVHDHPIVRHLTGFRVNSLEKAIDVVKAILL